jgi:membrane-associated protein
MDADVTAWIEAFSYPAVYLLLLLCGLGAPLSEDLIVLTGGWVAAKAGASPWAMVAVAYAGVLTGDFLLYRIGRSLGPRVLGLKRFAKVLTPERVAWVEGQFRTRGAFAVFLARFLPGVRAPTFLLAGVAGFPPRKFFLADGLAAAVTAPLMTFLGYRFGTSVLAEVKRAGRWILLAVAAAILVLLVVKWVRRRAASQVTPS